MAKRGWRYCRICSDCEVDNRHFIILANHAEEQKQHETLLTINEVAKRLKRAHSTIKKLVMQGVLRSTSDGMISEKAINDYLKNV